MNIIQTEIPDLLIIEPKVFGDKRGFFMETWQRDRYLKAGLDIEFVQDNAAGSSRGVLRGLHYQYPQPQGKLVQVFQGEVLDVAVDIRTGSPTFGKAVTCILSEDNRRQYYVPPGFAHGYYVLSEMAVFSYKCTDFYNPKTEGSILWNDPDLGIEWPVTEPILSSKDAAAPCLMDISKDRLPSYEKIQ